jgi:hypothetical protein
MDILNIDKIIKITKDNKDPLDARNHYLCPQHFGGQGSFRWLISGRSGKGKTNLVVGCIMMGWIRFDHLYLYVKDPTQPKYVLLVEWLNTMTDELKKADRYEKPIYTVISDVEKIIPVDKLNKDIINVAVFDDMLLEKDQDLIVSYFIRGRHKNVSCIYLTQNYYSKDKFIQNIKKNCNYFSVFGVSSMNELRHLASDLSFYREYKDFKIMLEKATMGPNDFLFIDTRTEIPLLQIRKGFDGVWDDGLGDFVQISKLLAELNIC